MTDMKPSGRGRPKGTGLDDTAQLKAIAGMIASTPGLKPTTAIRELGITDPSIIRRLRDKYNAAEAGLLAEMAPMSRQASAGDANSHSSGQSAAGSARSMALAQPPDHRLSEQAAPKPVVAEDQAPKQISSQRPGRAPDVTFAKLVGLSVGLFVSSLEAQASVAAFCLKCTPVGVFMQTQVVFAEAAIALTSDVMSAHGSIA
jgi:hypothetical protein